MHLSMRNTVLRFAAALISVSLFSCAGAPPQTAAVPTAPSWTLETPEPDATYTYFVGYADGEGDGSATEAASATLVAEILRYIGVTISADSTATARSTLDSFQADLVQTVKQTSTSRVAGFQISEKHIAERKAGGVTVYILGRYATADLNAEKRRIAGIFQEKLDAVAIPEAEGDAFLAEGDSVAAARKFIQAAAAASGSDVENAAIKFERNVNKAKNAVSLVALEKLADHLETSPRVPFASPLKAAVISAGRPLAAVPILVGYQARLSNGKMTTRTTSVISDSAGLVLFDHPAPDFVGPATLTMRLDLSSSTEAFTGLSARHAAMVAGLEDEIAAKRVSFAYAVTSAARSIPTAVVIADADADGALSVGTTTSALLQVFAKNGFIAFAAPMAAEGIVGADDAAILAAARAALAGKAQRLAWGTTRVVSVKDDSGKKVATVSAEIKVAELATGRLLYSSVKQVPALGSTEREAADAARRALGLKTIGEDLAASLP